MRSILTLIFLIFLALPAVAAPGAEKESDKEKFVIYYADKATLKDFKPFQLAVLDGDRHPDLQPLKEEGKTLLGYISLGEMNKNNPNYIALKNHNLILQENPNWKDSYFIDIRDPLWAKMVLEEIVPGVLRQGFDGVFLDTLDSSINLEDKNREKFAGMTDAAAHLVEAIRLHYPSIKIMMNRGYTILPKIASSVDMELGESVYANYNFDKKTYTKVNADDYQKQVQLLQDAKQKNPALKIYSLDYADPADDDAIKAIYKTERTNGFTPYVATIGLDRIITEPGTP